MDVNFSSSLKYLRCGLAAFFKSFFWPLWLSFVALYFAFPAFSSAVDSLFAWIYQLPFYVWILAALVITFVEMALSAVIYEFMKISYAAYRRMYYFNVFSMCFCTLFVSFCFYTEEDPSALHITFFFFSGLVFLLCLSSLCSEIYRIFLTAPISEELEHFYSSFSSTSGESIISLVYSSAQSIYFYFLTAFSLLWICVLGARSFYTMDAYDAVLAAIFPISLLSFVGMRIIDNHESEIRRCINTKLLEIYNDEECGLAFERNIQKVVMLTRELHGKSTDGYLSLFFRRPDINPNNNVIIPLIRTRIFCVMMFVMFICLLCGMFSGFPLFGRESIVLIPVLGMGITTVFVMKPL